MPAHVTKLGGQADLFFQGQGGPAHVHLSVAVFTAAWACRGAVLRSTKPPQGVVECIARGVDHPWLLSGLSLPKKDRRAARLAGLSTLAQSPRGGCKASAETFDEGMRQLSEAAGASSITAGLGFGGSAQLRSLSGLRISGLAERARECGVEREALDDALEGEAPKAAVIQLIQAAQQAQLEMG